MSDDLKQLTPMMQQYLKIHEEVPDAFLLFRLGDFYELFWDDAIKASKILDLTLTGKDCGLDERAPMCGVPYHAVDNYIAKLVDNGYKVAICEQVTDPSESNGLVERAIVRIITSGTVTDSGSLKEDQNNYIMSIYTDRVTYGVVYCDVSTGETYAQNIDGMHPEDDLFSLLSVTMPSEILVNTLLFQSFEIKSIIENITKRNLVPLPKSIYQKDTCERAITDQLSVFSLKSTGLENEDNLIKACGALFWYLKDTQKNTLKHIDKIYFNSKTSTMKLDYSTKRNLELTETIRNSNKKGSLLWVIDNTVTGVGARTLRRWVSEPLTDKQNIMERHDVLSSLTADISLIERIRGNLNKTSDLYRLTSKLSFRSANGRDLLAIKTSLKQIPELKKLISDTGVKLLVDYDSKLNSMPDIVDLLDRAINEDCSANVKDGNMIKFGYDSEADNLRMLKNNAHSVLSNLEAEEKERTGIKNLKIKYNKVFGYYIEVSNGNLSLVPERYIRKQTLVNGERFYTEELKDIEDKIVNAQSELEAVEKKLYNEILDVLTERIDQIKINAEAIGCIDALCSMAYVSIKNNYKRSVINDSGIIEIRDGRHPVIEIMNRENQFITNDVYLDEDKRRLALITGPNMAGKSTYIRQTALIVLMNQIGCFVPCSYSNLCIVDRIFTRVGASDDISAGQSTFMVEMSEVSNILKNATNKSLVILDEVGRGTGTLDGLSIAWAVVEYLLKDNMKGCKTLFATHYHELTKFDESSGLYNLHIDIEQTTHGVVFLHKISDGASDRSYGIEVAKLAGLPDEVINRSQDILFELEKNDKNINKNIKIKRNNYSNDMINLFNYNNERILNDIRNIPINEMTPLESLNYLQKIQKELQNE